MSIDIPEQRIPADGATQPNSERKATRQNFAKNIKALLVGVVLGVLLPIVLDALTPQKASVFSSSAKMEGPRWWVLIGQFEHLVFGNLPVQIFYVCLFAGLLILRPNHRYAWVYAFLVGYAIPVLIFHSSGLSARIM